MVIIIIVIEDEDDERQSQNCTTLVTMLLVREEIVGAVNTFGWTFLWSACKHTLRGWPCCTQVLQRMEREMATAAAETAVDRFFSVTICVTSAKREREWKTSDEDV